MKKIIEYITVVVGVSASGDRSFVAQVNQRIKEGYQPYGSISVIVPSNNYAGGEIGYCQPMVKYED